MLTQLSIYSLIYVTLNSACEYLCLWIPNLLRWYIPPDIPLLLSIFYDVIFYLGNKPTKCVTNWFFSIWTFCACLSPFLRISDFSESNLGGTSYNNIFGSLSIRLGPKLTSYGFRSSFIFTNSYSCYKAFKFFWL